MFKRLRNQLLVTNLGIITLLMVAAFSFVYFVTSSNIKEEIKMDLYRISDFRKNEPQLPPKEEFAKERMPLMFIETDADYNLLAWQSFFITDETLITEALQKIITVGTTYGQYRLDDGDWAYLIQKLPTGYRITSIDVTLQQSVLNRLIITFAIVTFVMLLIILVISWFLTERSIKPVKEAFEKQKQFISDASHELKTPLAVIRTNVDVLLDGSLTDDKKWLSYIKEEVERMGRLTNDLLYLTQMDGAEDLQMMKSTFNLSERLEHLLLGLEVMAFEKKISLDAQIEPALNCFGNPEQLSQVGMILLDNAIKYTPENGHIKVSLIKTPHHLLFSVSNSGAGITSEDLPFIFDRFFRADRSRTRENGSYGLGLAIAHAIVSHHGGKITCESTPGEWTTFTVKLKITT